MDAAGAADGADTADAAGNAGAAGTAGAAEAAGVGAAGAGTTGARIAVTAVVPARNAAASVGAVVAELRDHVDEVVVVDDASTDATATVAEAAGAVVLRNPRRLGYVGAIERGFAAARGGIVVTVDADGEMPAEAIPALVAPIMAGVADMVQGRRVRAPRISERAISALARLGGPVGDSGTGFRALEADLARRLVIRGSCICGSLALDALARGARVTEVPVRLRRVDGRRSIAWQHAGQAVTVFWLALRVRLRRTAP